MRVGHECIHVCVGYPYKCTCSVARLCNAHVCLLGNVVDDGVWCCIHVYCFTEPRLYEG